MGLFDGITNFALNKTGLADDAKEGIDEFRSDFSSLFNRNIADPVSNFLDESKYANDDTLLGQSLDFIGGAVSNTVDAIGDVASDMLTFQGRSSTLDLLDFALSDEIGEEAEEKGISKFEVGLNDYREKNKERISDQLNVASLFAGGGAGSAIAKVGGKVAQGLGKFAGAVAPAFLGESANPIGLGIGFGSLGLAEFNDSFQESIGRKNSEAIYEKLGVDDLGDQYTARLLKFTDKLDFDNISKEDVTNFNESLGEGVEVKTIQDLQNVVKGVNEGLGFVGRSLSNVSSGFDDLSNIIFTGVASDDQFSPNEEVTVLEGDIDGPGLPTLKVGSTSLDSQIKSFESSLQDATDKNAEIIQNNIVNIKKQFGINENQFIQTSTNRFQSIIDRHNDAVKAVSITEDLLNNEKDLSKKNEISQRLNQQLEVLTEYETRLDAIVRLTDAEIKSETKTDKKFLRKDGTIADTDSANDTVRDSFDFGASDPLDKIKKLQFEADGIASKDNASKVSADILGNMGRLLGTAGTNLAILTDSVLDSLGKDDFNTLLKYGIENTTNESDLPSNLLIDIVDGADKFIPYVSLYAAERLIKLPKKLIPKQTQRSAEDFLNNSPLWKNVTGKGSKTNQAVVQGIKGGVSETGEELIQLGIEGASQVNLLSGEEVLASTIIAQGVGGITNVMNVLDKYAKRQVSDEQTLVDYVKNSSNFDDIPVILSQNQTREATIAAVADIIIKSSNPSNTSGSNFAKQSVVLGSIDAGTKAIAAKTKQIEGKIFQFANTNGNFSIAEDGTRFQVYTNETWNAIKNGVIDSDFEVKYTNEALAQINNLVAPTIQKFKKDISELAKIAYEPSSKYKYDASQDTFVVTESPSGVGKSELENFMDLVREYNGKAATKNGQPVNSGGQRISIKELMGIDENMTQDDIFLALKSYGGKNTSNLYQNLLSKNNKWLWDNATIDVIGEDGKVKKVKTKKLSPDGIALINSGGLVGSEFDDVIGDNTARKQAQDMSEYIDALKGKTSEIVEGQDAPLDSGVVYDAEGNPVSQIEPNLRVSIDDGFSLTVAGGSKVNRSKDNLKEGYSEVKPKEVADAATDSGASTVKKNADKDQNSIEAKEKKYNKNKSDINLLELQREKKKGGVSTEAEDIEMNKRGIKEFDNQGDVYTEGVSANSVVSGSKLTPTYEEAITLKKKLEKTRKDAEKLGVEPEEVDSSYSEPKRIAETISPGIIKGGKLIKPSKVSVGITTEAEIDEVIALGPDGGVSGGKYTGPDGKTYNSLDDLPDSAFKGDKSSISINNITVNTDDGPVTLSKEVSSLLIERWNAKNRWNSNFNEDGIYTGTEYDRKPVGDKTLLVGKPDKRYPHPDVYYNLIKGKYPGLIESVRFPEIPQGKDLEVDKDTGEIREVGLSNYSSIEYFTREEVKEMNISLRDHKRLNLLLNRYFNFGSADFSADRFKNTKKKFEYAKAELEKFENEEFKIPKGKRSKFKGGSIDPEIWASSLLSEYNPIISSSGSEQQKRVWSFVTQEYLTNLYADFKGRELEVSNFVINLMNIKNRSTGRYNESRAKKMLDIMSSDKPLNVKSMYLTPQKYNDFGDIKEGSIKEIPASVLLVFGSDAPFTINKEFAQSVYKILARYSVVGDLNDTVLDRPTKENGQLDDHHSLALIKADQLIKAGLFKGGKLNQSFTFDDYYKKNEDALSSSATKVIEGLNDRLSTGSEVNDVQLYQVMNAIGLSIRQDKIPNFKAYISNLRNSGEDLTSISSIKKAYGGFKESSLAKGTVIGLAVATVKRKKTTAKKVRKTRLLDEKFDGRVIVEKNGSVNLMKNLINYLNGGKVDISAVGEIISLAVSLYIVDKDGAQKIVDELFRFQQNQEQLDQIDAIYGPKVIAVSKLISKTFFNPRFEYTDVGSYPPKLRSKIESANDSTTGLDDNELLRQAEEYLTKKKELNTINKEIYSKYSEQKSDNKFSITEKLLLEIMPIEEKLVTIQRSKKTKVKKGKDEFLLDIASFGKVGKGTPSPEGVKPIGEYSNFLLGLGFKVGSANRNAFVKSAKKIGFSEGQLKSARARYLTRVKNVLSAGVFDNKFDYPKKMVSAIIGPVPALAKKVVEQDIEEEVTLEYAEALLRAGKVVDIESFYDNFNGNPSSETGKAVTVDFLSRTENVEKIREILDTATDPRIIEEAKSRILQLVEEEKYTQGEAEGLFPDLANVENRVYKESLQANLDATNEVETLVTKVKTEKDGFFSKFLLNVAGRIRNKIPKFNEIHQSFFDYFGNNISPHLNQINLRIKSMKDEEQEVYLERIEQIRQDPTLAEKGEEYIVNFFIGLDGITTEVSGNRSLRARLMNKIDKEITISDLRNLQTIGRGGLLSYLKYYNSSTYKDILPVGDNVDGFVSMFGGIRGETATTSLTPLEIKTLFDAYGRERLTSYNFLDRLVDWMGSTKWGKRAAIFVPTKATIGAIGKTSMFISYVVPSFLLQYANPLVAIAQQIVPTAMQYFNNVNHGHRSNEKSNGKNMVDKINEDFGIFPETYVTSPERGIISSIFALAGNNGVQGLNRLNGKINKYSAVLNTGPQQLLDVIMNDAFNKIAIQAVLDRYGSREEALSRIYNPDGSIKEDGRFEFTEQVKDYKKNTLFKFDNGYDTYHTGGWFMSMLMLNGGRGFSHARLVFDNLTNGKFAKVQAKALEDGVDPQGVFGSQFENVRFFQNVMNTMLYAYRLQRLLDEEDEEDDDQTKLSKVMDMFKYLYQGSQAFQSAGINRVGIASYEAIRKTFAAHMMHGNEDKLRTDPEGYEAMLTLIDTILKEGGRGFYFSDQAADVLESISRGESLDDIGLAIYDNITYKTISLLRFFTDDVENEFGLISPQSNGNYVDAILGKKDASELYGRIRNNLSMKDLVDSDGNIDLKSSQAWILKKLPHIARLGLDEDYLGVYLGDDKRYAKAVDFLKKNNDFFQKLQQGDLSGLSSEENIKYTRDILYNYVSNPYTNLQDNSEDNDENVSPGSILFASELKKLLGDAGFESYEESLTTNRFIMKEEQVTRQDILNKAVLSLSAGELGKEIPAGATQHFLTLTAGYLRDEVSKFYIDPKTGKPFKSYNDSNDNPHRNAIDEIVGKELLPYLEMANKNDYIDMVSEVVGGRSEMFEVLLDDNGNFRSEKLRRIFRADMASSLAVSKGDISGAQMYNIYNQLAAKPKKGAETDAEKKKAQDEADAFNISMALDIFDNIEESLVPKQDKVDIILPIVGNNEELFAKAINDKEFQKVIGEERIQNMKNFLYGNSKDIDHLPRAIQNIAGMEGGYSGSTRSSTKVKSSISAVPKARSFSQLKFQKFISNNIKYEDLKVSAYKPPRNTHTSRQSAVYRASTGSVRTRGIKSMNERLKSSSKTIFKPKSSRSDLKRILKILGG